MSSRLIRSVVLSFALILTVLSMPAAAATRDATASRDRELPTITKVIRQLQKFGIRALTDTLTLPKP